ncbi:MAG: APC family permease [Phycisphaerae bacterium]|nr:APC family permease [Phycisphaerae bacterium]
MDRTKVTASTSAPSGDGKSLRQIIGAVSIVGVGVGGAIGSGIFRTPGELAQLVQSPWHILGLWAAAGVLTLMQSLVTAELATRMPEAGGEYQYLKAAYGRFAAFIFGWSFTIFIIGAGGATIAAALGDFAATLCGLNPANASPRFACAAIALVTGINCLGLRTGAITQNLLTGLKVASVIGIAAGAMIVAGRWIPAEAPAQTVSTASSSIDAVAHGTAVPMSFWGKSALLFQAMLLAFWPYTGATDPAKLAEETRDVRHAMPRALVTTVVILTIVYMLYNYALLCAMPPSTTAARPDVHSAIFHDVKGLPIETLILIASILICLGALSSVFLANTRVTFALARDGLTFQLLGRMSPHQAPTASLIACGAIACAFALSRGFSQILSIYFMGSTILFGLAYASLIVLRRRDAALNQPFPSDAFRLPGGIPIACVLILVEVAIAASLVHADVMTWSGPAGQRSYDTLYSLSFFGVLAIFFLAWRRRRA